MVVKKAKKAVAKKAAAKRKPAAKKAVAKRKPAKKVAHVHHAGHAAHGHHAGHAAHGHHAGSEHVAKKPAKRRMTVRRAAKKSE